LGPLAGYTNPRSCSNAFAKIKKKLAELADSTGALPPADSTKNDDANESADAPKGKAKPTAKAKPKAKPKEDLTSKSRPTPKRNAPKRKAADEVTDDGSQTEETGNATDHADADADTEGEEPNEKKKATAAKPKSKAAASAKSKPTANGSNARTKKLKVEDDVEDDVPAPDARKLFPNLKGPGKRLEKTPRHSMRPTFF